MKHRKAIVICAACVAFAGTCFYIHGRSTGPKHNGKTAQEWFDAINVRQYGTVLAPGGFGVANSDPAIHELVAMGPDSVPFLLEMYTARETSLRFRVAIYLGRWAPRMTRYGPDLQRHYKANLVLAAMGPQAASAVPELARLVRTANHSSRVEAIQLLGFIHGQPELAVPLLIEGLQDPKPTIRFACLQALGRYGADARAALPELNRLMPAGDTGWQIATAETIGDIEGQHDQLLAIALRELNRPESEWRAAAAEALGKLGREAKPALPALMQAAHDDDSELHFFAMDAIKKIDPLFAKKALPK